MRILNNKKEFIIDNEALKELCKDDNIRYCILKMNHAKRWKELSKQCSKLERYIKIKYNCNKVSYHEEILEPKYSNGIVYKQIIKLPIFCGCCHDFYYKEDMYNEIICHECYNDACSLSVCARCGGYSDLECNCY